MKRTSRVQRLIPRHLGQVLSQEPFEIGLGNCPKLLPPLRGGVLLWRIHRLTPQAGNKTGKLVHQISQEINATYSDSGWPLKNSPIRRVTNKRIASSN